MLTFSLSTLRIQFHCPPLSVITDGKSIFILTDIFLSFLFSLIVFKIFCSFIIWKTKAKSSYHKRVTISGIVYLNSGKKVLKAWNKYLVEIQWDDTWEQQKVRNVSSTILRQLGSKRIGKNLSVLADWDPRFQHLDRSFLPEFWQACRATQRSENLEVKASDCKKSQVGRTDSSGSD